MDSYDLTVVGGSFGGLACAGAAAARGLKTLVIDKKKSPDSYTQSTGIFVKEIADQVDLPSGLVNKIHGVRLYSPNLQYIDLKSPGYYFLATDTCAVLKWFSDQALNNGAELWFGKEVKSGLTEGHEILLPEHNIKSSYLVGADGATSEIADIFQLGRNSEFLLGSEYEVSGVEGLDKDFLHVFLDSELAPGYIAWIVPGVRLTQIGLATKFPVRPNIPKFYNKVIDHFGLKNTEIINRRGGYIPCGGPVNPIARDNICLLGDAAGFVSPMTAGGIHPAIEIGRMLGISISDYLQDGGYPPELVIKKHIPSYRYKKLLRNVNNIFIPPNSVLNFLLNNYLFKKTAQLIFFHHRGLMSVEAWKEILGNKK